MHTMNLADAKARLSKILNEVEAGEEVIITRHGIPIARVVPARGPRKPLQSLATFRAQFPPVRQSNVELIRALRGEGY
ncbi:type II toxin-antitoxin system Phd/YefM family antitoxin [Acidiferrobacter sp. SPIII_3]|nr:type II toxin-antitoxin system Phd/YefM family antitoxin [Acidiferrobacter sp. SPIII_3]